MHKGTPSANRLYMWELGQAVYLQQPYGSLHHIFWGGIPFILTVPFSNSIFTKIIVEITCKHLKIPNIVIVFPSD